jgi:hypothetical protein
MAQLNAAQHVSLVAHVGTGQPGDDRAWLYKADYPRWIDQYIDFFGGGRGEWRVSPGSLA